LLHLGQSVLLDVSITFLRSAVLAILAMEGSSPNEYGLRSDFLFFSATEFLKRLFLVEKTRELQWLRRAPRGNPINGLSHREAHGGRTSRSFALVTS
jgi:hypothetical protein